MAPIEKQPPKPPNRIPIQPLPPEPASINAILRKHSRERLFVNPLQWTATHLNLLGCHFQQTDMTTPLHQHPQPQPPSSRLRRLERHLFPPQPTRESTMLILRKIFHLHNMSSYNTPPWSRGMPSQIPLPFSFATTEAGRVVTRGVYCAPGSTSPSVAYLDFDLVDMYRRRSVRCARVSPLSKYNTIITRLQQKRFRRLTPADPLEDPYVAATMVALAQAQRREASGQDERTHWVTHLVALASAGLYFYRASVSRAFLDRFDEPSRGVEGCRLRIEYAACNSGELLWRAFDIMTASIHGNMEPTL